MRRVLVLALSLGLLSIFAVNSTGIVTAQRGPSSFSSDDPLVMALYYPWYDVSTWESGITSDYPLLPYESWERDAIERHVGWAREAGIDALVSAWFGPRGNNPTENNFKTLLDAAKPTSLKAALLVETDSDQFFPDRGALVTGLRHALSTHATHPSYLKVDGKPVIFVWRPSAVFAPNGARVNQKGAATVAAWRSILDEVDPNRQALWIGEGEDTSILGVFDGIFPYSIAWAGDPAGQLSSYAGQVRAFNAANGTSKLWIATAMPGYNDLAAPGGGRRFAVDRADGAYYQRTFQGAIATRPDWVMITSFNEWVEGHQIEPSRSYGTRFLELTRSLGDAFRQTTAGGQ